MKEFKYVFQTAKKISFEVRYSTVGSNSKPDFATSANELNRNNTDYERCGQAQKDLLPEKSVARAFFDKWDVCHLKTIADERKLQELERDIEVLKEKYNYLEKKANSFGRGKYDGEGSSEFHFSDVVALSKQVLKSVAIREQKRKDKYRFRVLDKRKVGRYNEYLVENIKTGQKAVFNSEWVKEQVNKGIVTNMGISNGSLYSIKDKLDEVV